MPRIPKRPDYGNATPEDLARALMRPVRPREKPTEPAEEQGEQSSGVREDRPKYQK